MNSGQSVKAFLALPEPLWEAWRVSVGAFAVLTCIGYGAGLARPAALDALLALFADAAGSLLSAQPSGAALLWAIFVNNLFALFFAVAMGFLPFLRLPALELGLNALLLGGFAAYYQRSGLGLVAYLAGTLPHGLTELAALTLACGAGLCLCRAVSARLLGREGAPSVRETFGECMRAYARVIVPLLLVSAAIEAFVTPLLLARFL